MHLEGVRFKDYKSFIAEYTSIENIEKINVFIGRNNSGKSSCLDIIENLINPYVLAANKFQKNDLDIQVIHKLQESDISSVFSRTTGGGGIPGSNHYEFGKNYIDKKMTFSVLTGIVGLGSKEKIFKYEYAYNGDEFDPKYDQHWKLLARREVNAWAKCKFRRLDAERNIVAEVESDEEDVSLNGAGASNLIRKILNHSEYDENIVQEKLLKALNEIIYPDAKFDTIKIQQVSVGDELKWEIFLQENGNRFALSKMGSGLKTIILVLINLLIIPTLKEYRNKQLIYALEELENNLHPALQRRLFEYIYNYCSSNDIIVFLTTHSHVAINTFCDKGNSQIFHVEKEDGVSKLHKIDDYISKTILLNDLDVRASDLLQSNGIIWVEGPSDRIYIKRWIELMSEGRLQEGRDYQFLYYSGRLLYHYTTEQECNDLINILLTNRNAAIVIDSDKRTTHARLNDTKKRIIMEFEKSNAFCWVTKGKEIENYLEKEAIEKSFGISTIEQCQQYQLFPEYIETVCSNFKKVDFAQKVTPNITVEGISKMMDLEKQIVKLIEVIKGWNHM